MKSRFLFLMLFFIANRVFAQHPEFSETTNIFLVRHAEKVAGKDPVLTEAGNKRAGDLMRFMQGKNLKRIYTTPVRRTVMTADSLRLQLGIDTSFYKQDSTGDDLLHRLATNNDLNNTILIIGHSNTIPGLIKALGVKNFNLMNIADNEFDNIYLVKFKNKQAYLQQFKYGSPSALSQPMKMDH